VTAGQTRKLCARDWRMNEHFSLLSVLLSLVVHGLIILHTCISRPSSSSATGAIMSTSAYHDPSASGSSHLHLYSSASTHQDHPTSHNSHHDPGHSSHSEMDGADGYHAKHSYSSIQKYECLPAVVIDISDNDLDLLFTKSLLSFSSTGRDDTYVRGQYTQRPRDYEYGGSTNWTHGASWTLDTNGDREGYLGHSDHKTFATSLDKTPRRLLSGRENLVAHKKSAEDGALFSGPIPAYQGGKGNGAETTTKDSLQKKLGQSSGLADVSSFSSRLYFGNIMLHLESQNIRKLIPTPLFYMDAWHIEYGGNVAQSHCGQDISRDDHPDDRG